MLIDVHAHLEHPAFAADLPKVLDDASKSGVAAVISSGTDYKTNLKTLEIARRFPLVKPSLGIYPLEGLKLSEKELEENIDFIRSHKKEAVGIGEIGMDLKDGRDSEKQQRSNFLKLLQLSEELNLPVIIHSRKAEAEVIDVLETFKAKRVIMHCFSGSMSLVKRAEDNGWFFSIPCNILFSSHFQELAKRVSISQLLTETDAPLLPPVKGQRNEPKNVAFTIKKISELKGLDEEETKNMVFMNYKRAFG